MIEYKKDILNKSTNWDDKSIYVITDFDRTLTTAISKSSWSILSASGVLPIGYNIEAKKLYDIYRSYEINESMPFPERNRLMIEWWTKHINLFVKYGLKEKDILEALSDDTILSFRDGALRMLKGFYERNIPVIIMSAGLGNIIKLALKKCNSCFSNIFIVSNFIKFENGIAVGMEDEIIHSLNKNEAFIPREVLEVIRNKDNAILIGDQIPDINMVNNKDKALKIGFCEDSVEDNKKYFDNLFDVVCTDNTTFDNLAEEVMILKKLF